MIRTWRGKPGIVSSSLVRTETAQVAARRPPPLVATIAITGFASPGNPLRQVSNARQRPMGYPGTPSTCSRSSRTAWP